MRTSQALAGCAGVACFFAAVFGGVCAYSMEPRDAEKVQEVLSGQRDTANAAWWGFDEEDSTAYLRQALGSGARTVIIPNMGSDWVTGPIRLPRDNQEIVLEEGVVISAKRDGTFARSTEQLIALYRRDNVVIRGYGATVKMWKEDYTREPYAKGEHRHALGLHLSRNIQILGLTIRDSGGDGIYVRGCESVLIKDVVADGNHRQGISVVGAKDLLIEDTVLRNTSGTSPESGIDIEPNFESDRLDNVVIRNTVSEHNAGRGFIVNVNKLTSHSAPVSIRFENCIARHNLEGISLMRLRDADAVGGTIEFVNTLSEGSRLAELAMRDISADAAAEIRFDRCTFRGGSLVKQVLYFGLEVRYEGNRPTRRWGGIRFADCVAEAFGDTLFVAIKPEVMRRGGIHDVTGHIALRSTHPEKAMSGELMDTLANAGLTVTTVKTDYRIHPRISPASPYAIAHLRVDRLNEIVLAVQNQLEENELRIDMTLTVDATEAGRTTVTARPGERVPVAFALPFRMTGMHRINAVVSGARPENLPDCERDLAFDTVVGQKMFRFDDTLNKVLRVAFPDSIDGNIAKWSELPCLLLKRENAEGVEARLYTGWDDNCFHLAVAVRDEQHVNVQTGSNIWNGDSLQFAVAPRGGMPFNLGLALARGSIQAHQWMGPDTGVLGKSTYTVVRDNDSKTTVYELRIPFECLGIKPLSGTLFGFNAVVFNNDAGDRYDYWIQLSPGLVGGWSPETFNTFVLWD